MERTYERALSSGRAQIWARPKPLSDFVQLYPDQWRLFAPVMTRHEDRAIIDRAIGPDGVHVYSPHVVAAPSSVADSRSLARDEAIVTALIRIIRANPSKRTMNIVEIIAWARKNWGSDLSAAEITRCRRDAIKAAGSNEWDKGGRPEKSPR
jgi:hypothetical protein